MSQEPPTDGMLHKAGQFVLADAHFSQARTALYGPHAIPSRPIAQQRKPTNASPDGEC